MKFSIRLNYKDELEVYESLDTSVTMIWLLTAVKTQRNTATRQDHPQTTHDWQVSANDWAKQTTNKQFNDVCIPLFTMPGQDCT